MFAGALRSQRGSGEKEVLLQLFVFCSIFIHAILKNLGIFGKLNAWGITRYLLLKMSETCVYTNFCTDCEFISRMTDNGRCPNTNVDL